MAAGEGAMMQAILQQMESMQVRDEERDERDREAKI
jgi:hypothetical protein